MSPSSENHRVRGKRPARSPERPDGCAEAAKLVVLLALLAALAAGRAMARRRALRRLMRRLLGFVALVLLAKVVIVSVGELTVVAIRAMADVVAPVTVVSV